jgi:hypothetical protein
MALRPKFSRLARHRGILPSEILLCDDMVAMKYVEDGKHIRWGLQRLDGKEIAVTWSHLAAIVRSICGDETVCEIFPREGDTVATANVRWFWIMPSLSPEFDLRQNNAVRGAAEPRTLDGLVGGRVEA